MDGISGISAAHCQMANGRIIRRNGKRTCIADVYTKICIRTYIGYINTKYFFVFLEGTALLSIFVSLHAVYSSIPTGWCCYQKANDGSK